MEDSIIENSFINGEGRVTHEDGVPHDDPFSMLDNIVPSPESVHWLLDQIQSHVYFKMSEMRRERLMMLVAVIDCAKDFSRSKGNFQIAIPGEKTYFVSFEDELKRMRSAALEEYTKGKSIEH